MIGDLLGGAGLLAATGCAAASLLLPPSRWRSSAMGAAIVLVPALIVGDQWDSALISGLRDHPLRLAALILGAVVVTGALAVAFRARPILLPLAVIAALPFRVPIHAGGDEANLLIPLYLVIAAGVLAMALTASSAGGAGGGVPHRAERSEHGGGASGDRTRGQAATGDRTRGQAATSWLSRGQAATWLPKILAAVVVLYALQTLYSEDFSLGLQTVCFFLVPFALMFTLLTEVRWDRRLITASFAVIVVEGIVFVGVGIVEYALRELLWNQQVIHSNDFRVSAYFRVNSLFWDPNILGRYLALAILLALAVVLWTRDRRDAIAAAAIVAFLWIGLLITFSQSSFVALLAGLALLAALRWSVRATAAACGVAAIVVAAIVLAFGNSTSFDLTAQQVLNRGTSGRASLVSGGLDLAAERPLWGWGAGSFVAAYRGQREKPDVVAASHTEPVTVAAEQGALGIVAYLALLAVALAALLAGMRSIAPGLGGRGPPAGDAATVARIGVAAAFAALVVHTMAYASFLPDPITWVLLAAGARMATPGPESGESAEPGLVAGPVRAAA